MSSSKPRPCAACKFYRRKCGEECVFAPHFPPDQIHKIETLQKVYGGANVGRILRELPAAERGAAVNSLVYEAEARVKDPVYGCVGSIATLQHKLKKVQTEINTTKQELATYMGPCVLKPGFMPQFINQQPGSSADAHQQDMLRSLDQQQLIDDLSRFDRRFDGAGPSHQHNQPSYETQQLTEAAREQDLHQQQQIQNQQQLMDRLRFKRSFDGPGHSGEASYSGFGFMHLTGPGEMCPSLPFGGSYGSNVCQIQQQPQEEVFKFNNLQNQLSDMWHYPEQEQNHNLNSLLPHQLLLQQQNQPLQSQPQPHSQQEQHDHIQQLIEHQHENQQSQLRQHPQQEKKQHLQSLLLPHQLLLQDQTTSMRRTSWSSTAARKSYQIKPFSNNKNSHVWQPQANHGGGSD